MYRPLFVAWDAYRTDPETGASIPAPGIGEVVGYVAVKDEVEAVIRVGLSLIHLPFDLLTIMEPV